MILLHTYSPDPLYAARQRQTLKAINRFKAEFYDLSVVDVECTTDNDYENSMKAQWGNDDLITLEQDLAPTNNMLSTLAGCHEPICAQYYAVRKCLRIVGPDEQKWCVVHYYPYSPFRQVSSWGPEGPVWSWHEADEEYASLGPLGFTKFSKEFQEQHPLVLPSGSWRDLDRRISKWIWSSGYKFHVHQPPAQHHDEIEGQHNEYRAYSVAVNPSIPYPSDEWFGEAIRQFRLYLIDHDPLFIPSYWL